MSSVVAKKYVKGLISASSESEFEQFTENMKVLNSLFSDEKFKDIILSTEVTSEAKVDFVLGLVEGVDDKFKNLIRLLAEHKRLMEIPYVYNEMRLVSSTRKNSFDGIVISNNEMAEETIKLLEDSFSKRLGSTIVLNPTVGNYDGVKVEIEDLGVEISFSNERLKADMVAHILKAI